MRDPNIYNLKRALPRMVHHFIFYSANATPLTGPPTQSWTPVNLYNLWRRSLGEVAKEADFTRTQKSLFQQRWIAKRLIRAYHGDFINEKTFKRWYLPTTLPDVRPRRGLTEVYTTQLNKWAKLPKAVDNDAKSRKREIDGEDQEELPPVGSLMFSEVERRIDVVIFRACLAHSVYDARRMVIHGRVLLNGKKVCCLRPLRLRPTKTLEASKREYPPCARGYGICRPKNHFLSSAQGPKRGQVLRRAGCGRAQRRATCFDGTVHACDQRQDSYPIPPACLRIPVHIRPRVSRGLLPGVFCYLRATSNGATRLLGNTDTIRR